MPSTSNEPASAPDSVIVSEPRASSVTTMSATLPELSRTDEAVAGRFVLEVGTEHWMADVRADLTPAVVKADVPVIPTPVSPHGVWMKAEGLVRTKTFGSSMADVWRSLAAFGDGRTHGDEGPTRAGFTGQRRRGVAESVWKSL